MRTKDLLVCINDVPLVAKSAVIQDGEAELKVAAGTTGLCDGDREAGGRTFISLEDIGLSDLLIRTKKSETGRVKGIEIAASGDDALVAILGALIHITESLLADQTEVDE